MKSVLVLAALMIAAPSFAASIASCASVEHHGDYVEIKDDGGKITVEMSNDGDDTGVLLTGVSIFKNPTTFTDGRAASWAIRSAIRGSREVSQTGVVVIKGSKGGQKILINLNTYSGQNFLVSNDYVQQLNCTVPGDAPVETETELTTENEDIETK